LPTSFWRYWIADPLAAFPKLLALKILRLLPTDWVSLIGARIGASAASTSRGLVIPGEHARANWLRFNPGTSDHVADTAMEHARRHAGRLMTEYAIVDRLWTEGRVAVEGAEHVAKMRAAGRPLIVATLHLANFELVGPVLMGLGHPPIGIYEPPENRFVHAAVVKARERYGGEVLPPGSGTARAALHTLKERKLPLVMLIDDLTNGRVQAPAFGRRLLPDGNLVKAARLASLADAEIILGYALRTEAARFRFIFSAPLPLARSGNRESDLAANTQILNSAIEPIIHANLEQWYMLEAFRFEDA
jgi:Kdo2-lipid IVA lauroyltransferase/acyltransferase